MKPEHKFRFNHSVYGKPTMINGVETAPHIVDIEVNGIAYMTSDNEYHSFDIDYLRWAENRTPIHLKAFSDFIQWIAPDFWDELNMAAEKYAIDNFGRYGRSLSEELRQNDLYEHDF